MRALSIVLRLAAAENGGGCVRTTCRGLLALAALQSLPVTRRLLFALVSCPKKICSRIAKFYEHNIQTHSNQNLRVIPERIQGRGRRWTASEEEEQAKQRAGCGRCPLLGGERPGALQEGREEQKKDKVSVAMTGSTHTRRAGVEARAGEGVTLAAAAPRALLCNWHIGASTAQPVFGYIIVTERGGG